MSGAADRLRGQLRRVRAERDAFHDALKRICLLGMEDSVGDARMIAGHTIGLRYLNSVQVIPEKGPPIVIDADGNVNALCPKCRDSHKLSPPGA